MKKVLLTGLFFMTLSYAANAQTPTAGVYLFMSSAGVATGAGVAADFHPDEVELQSVQNGFTAQGPGAPQISSLLISKRFDKSSLRLKNQALIGGTPGSACEIRYYNGIAASPVYVIKLSNIKIESYSAENSSCTNCPDLNESFAITAVIIEWRNQAVTPNQVLTHNTITNTTTFSNN